MNEIQVAIQAAQTAGHVLREAFTKPHLVNFKGVIDIVTEMDRESERLVCEILRREFPSYGILGEEGSQVNGTQEARWIIDPLDGTTNYSKSYPFFCVSIALEKGSDVVAGVVYNPLLDELFIAQKGAGASLNGRALHVSTCPELGKSLIASGFPYDAWDNPKNNVHEWGRLVQKTISMRSDGSAALDLCHVAAGRLDAYWELDLEVWDIAAGALMVQEAGGMLTSCSGEPYSHLNRSVLASNGLVHNAVLEAFRDG